jgi:hypothetical protein
MTCTTNAVARKSHGGASHTAPNPTPQKGVTAIMLRIRLRRYRDALGKNIQRLGRLTLLGLRRARANSAAVACVARQTAAAVR